MATHPIHDLCVVKGTYVANGETKKKYLNIGMMMEKDDGGRFMLLDPTVNLAAIPREGDMVLVSMFDSKDANGKPYERTPPAGQQHQGSAPAPAAHRSSAPAPSGARAASGPTPPPQRQASSPQRPQQPALGGDDFTDDIPF